MPKRPELERKRLVEAHDKIRKFAADLQAEGYSAVMLCDALFAAAVNGSVLVAGAEATADALFEWGVRVQRIHDEEQSAAQGADAMLDRVLQNFHTTTKKGH